MTDHGPGNSKFNLLDEMESVLRDAGESLYYGALAERLLSRGQWITKSNTPGAVVNVSVSRDLKAHGDQSRFIRDQKRKGYIALRQSPPSTDDSDDASPTGKKRPKGGSARSRSGDPTGMSFADAAEHVLDRFGNRKPMHYTKIAEKALERGLIRTMGKTPAISVSSVISTEIKRQMDRGETPRFVRSGGGFIALTRWQKKGLMDRVQEHNAHVRGQLHQKLHTMPPIDFEALIGQLLAEMGFADVSVGRYTGDGGIDVRGTLVVGDVIRTQMAVQVKRHQQNIQAPIVQQVRGSLGAHEQGLIITTSGFSKGATEEARSPNKNPIGLMDGEQLVALLVEHGLLVQREPFYLLELAKVDESPSADGIVHG
ncbi:MAG: HTH domain-containing protein [Chloroflexota bacterium]|nr:HTH domain-containing protein [Chloroflexota bacterium]